MTYNEALGAIIWGAILTVFVAWYAWCVYTMFFRCVRPRDFFSQAYSTSGPFMIVNLIGFTLAAAWVLMAATN